MEMNIHANRWQNDIMYLKLFCHWDLIGGYLNIGQNFFNQQDFGVYNPLQNPLQADNPRQNT